MKEINFQKLLTDNYCINSNSIHICFPINIKSIKRKTNGDVDIDGDLITVNNFFAYFVHEISVKMYGNDKELIPTFSPHQIYKYSDGMVKHFPKDTLKKIERTLLYSNKAVYLNNANTDRRNHNDEGLTTTTEMNATEIANLKKNYAKDLKSTIG